MCLLANCMPFSVKCLFTFFAHFQKLGWLSFSEFWIFFEYSIYKPFIKYVICKYFLPGCGFSFHSLNSVFLLQKGIPFTRPESRLLSNTWDCPRRYAGWQSKKGSPGGEQQDKGAQENCSAPWLAILGFMVAGFTYGLSLASHCDSGSFPVAHALHS